MGIHKGTGSALSQHIILDKIKVYLEEHEKKIERIEHFYQFRNGWHIQLKYFI